MDELINHEFLVFIDNTKVYCMDKLTNKYYRIKFSDRKRGIISLFPGVPDKVMFEKFHKNSTCELIYWHGKIFTNVLRHGMTTWISYNIKEMVEIRNIPKKTIFRYILK